MPILIGVCSFDSVRASCALESLADLVRERGGGDIRWKFLHEEQEAAECDFYLMTSLQFSPYLARGDLDCAFIVTSKEGQRYSRGAVIVRPGTDSLRPELGRVIFTSPVSASGFLSPYLALKEAGFDTYTDLGSVDFAGYYPNEERVIFGVLFGAYQGGGIGLERFRYLQRCGVIEDGGLEVLIESDPLPEIILAVDPSFDSKKLRGFRSRLLSVFERVPRSLAVDLAELGIAGFVLPRDDDKKLLLGLSSHVPTGLPIHRTPYKRDPSSGWGGIE